MKRYFKDSYGCTASITVHRDLSATLRIAYGNGRHVFGKVYGTETGARQALGKWSDCWKETTKK